jgi:hypothetical protein
MVAPPKAKRSMGRKKKGTGDEPPTATAKIDRALLGKARIVANDLGVDLATYLSDLIRDPVSRAFAKIVKKMEQEDDNPPPKR